MKFKKSISLALVMCMVLSLFASFVVSAEEAAEVTNIAAGKEYTITDQFRQGGKEVNWGWDPNAAVVYPDEGGTLTDGVFDPGDNVYTNAVWAGFNHGTPSYKDAEYPNHKITVDLGAVTEIEGAAIYLATSTLGNGINYTYSFISVSTSDDGENWTTLDYVEISDDVVTDANYAKVAFEKAGSGRFVQFRLAREGWLFVSEVEVYGIASAEEEPEEPATEVISLLAGKNTDSDGADKMSVTLEDGVFTVESLTEYWPSTVLTFPEAVTVPVEGTYVEFEAVIEDAHSLWQPTGSVRLNADGGSIWLHQFGEEPSLVNSGDSNPATISYKLALSELGYINDDLLSSSAITAEKVTFSNLTVFAVNGAKVTVTKLNLIVPVVEEEPEVPEEPEEPAYKEGLTIDLGEYGMTHSSCTNVEDIEAGLTDGVKEGTGFGTAGNYLIGNSASSDATLHPEVSYIFNLGDVKAVEGVVFTLYSEVGSMVGYPGQIAVVYVSEDGIEWTAVESTNDIPLAVYDFDNADNNTPAGAVTATIALNEVAVAQYVKTVLQFPDSPFTVESGKYTEENAKPVWEWYGLTEVEVDLVVPSVEAVLPEGSGVTFPAGYGAIEVLGDGYTGVGEIDNYDPYQAYLFAFRNGTTDVESTYSIEVDLDTVVEFNTVTAYALSFTNGNVGLPKAVSVTIGDKTYDAVIGSEDNAINAIVAELGETVEASEFTINVTMNSGAVKYNMYSEIEVALVEAVTPEAPADSKEIVDDAFALESGAELPYVATLTGEIVKINTPYSEQYGNITVTITVEGSDGVKELLCYRIKGEGADTLAVGDTITVTGTIINYNGTIEYSAGSTIDAIEKGEGEVPVAPEDPKEIVDAAFGLEEGASLPYNATLTGVIVSVDTAYDAGYNNVTVSIEVEGTDGLHVIQCFRLKGEGADVIGVGDTITVTGVLKNYYGKIEFDSGCTLDSYVEYVPEYNEIEVNVNDNAVLTDGKTGFTGNWGEVGTGDVLLITNGECKNMAMQVVLNYALGETKNINGLVLDFYHCAAVMIGYPEGQILVEVSVDGENWTKVGLFDLAAAELANGKYGTVSSALEFDAVEAAYVKATFVVGSSTGVLGDSPADGKVFWEFASLAEVAVTEVKTYVTGNFAEEGLNGVNQFAANAHNIWTGSAASIEWWTKALLQWNAEAQGWEVLKVQGNGKVDWVIEGNQIVIAAHADNGTAVASIAALQVGDIVYIWDIGVATSDKLAADLDCNGGFYTTDASKVGTTAFTYKEKTILAGDVNMDGAITDADYMIIRKLVVGTEDEADYTAEQLKLADVNGNGVIDANDYLVVKRHALGTYVIPAWR